MVVEYLSIGGAGNRAPVFFGVLRAMQASSIHGQTWQEFSTSLKGTAGSSAGALAALTICLGLDADTVTNICMHLLDDIANVFTNPDIGNLVDNYGIDNCGYLRSVISRILRTAGLCEDTTFANMERLIRCEFACTGTNLNTRRGEIFSGRMTPNMKVVDAVAISMNVPVLFAPVRHGDDLYVDGSLTIRAPCAHFDFDRTEFWLLQPSARSDINSWRDFVRCLMDLQTDSMLQVERSSHVLWIQPYGAEEPVFDFMGAKMRTASQLQMQAGYVSAMRYIYPGFDQLCARLLTCVVRCCVVVSETDAAAAAADQCTEEGIP
jgi:predicted acylesterase/phospholipase RssA